MSSENSVANFSTSLEIAQHAPEQYLKLLSEGAGSDVPGGEQYFLVRRSDIANIRNYVREARLLPIDLSKVQDAVGYTVIKIPELEPASIQQFNQCVVKHAETWGVLERDTKELARQLDTFSAKFLGTGKHILDIINKVELERLLTGGLEALTSAELEALSLMKLSANEHKVVDVVKEYLDQMRQSTQVYIRNATAVGSLATEFERTLTEELIPAAQLKVRAYEKSPLANEQKELLEEIKDLDDRIDQLKKEYDKNVGQAFTGLMFGPLGVVITGGIFGAKAEKIRAKRNAEIEKRKTLRQANTQNQKLIKLLDDVQVNLTGLNGRMKSAEVGAKQLAQVWSYIEKYLEEAFNSLDKIDHLAALHAFALEFSLALNPWEQIKNYSSQIASAFNDALEQSQ